MFLVVHLCLCNLSESAVQQSEWRLLLCSLQPCYCCCWLLGVQLQVRFSFRTFSFNITDLKKNPAQRKEWWWFSFPVLSLKGHTRLKTNPVDIMWVHLISLSSVLTSTLFLSGSDQTPITVRVTNSVTPTPDKTYSTYVVYRGILLGGLRRLQESEKGFK